MYLLVASGKPHDQPLASHSASHKLFATRKRQKRIVCHRRSVTKSRRLSGPIERLRPVGSVFATPNTQVREQSKQIGRTERAQNARRR